MYKMRSFTIVHLKFRQRGKAKAGKRYTGKTPLEAAKKAFALEGKKTQSKKRCSYILIVKETSRGSKRKLYRYKIIRTKIQKSKNKKIEYKVSFKTLKVVATKRRVKSKKPNKPMKGGGGMDIDDEEGIYTGFYNIIAHDTIIHTDNFLLPEEHSEEWIAKQIIKQHKKDFKRSGLKKKDVSIEIFDTMFYPREEGPRAVKEALDVQLPHIREEMQRLQKKDVQQRKKNAFDLSSIKAALDDMF